MPSDAAARAGTVLEIDLAAVAANWRLLENRVRPAGCAAVVKADAYGLGAARVAPALAAAGCRLFFVATLDEGIALRDCLPAPAEIAVLNGPFPGTAAAFCHHRLTPVLNDEGQAAEWQGAGPAMLQFDTGMNRLGFSTAALAETAREDRAWRALLSHLACAEAADHALNEVQRARFAAARDRLPRVPASLAASSGIFLGAAFHFDFVRPGAALYGINPVPGAPNPMRPVVRLGARIIQLREVRAGDSVGYGGTHVMSGRGTLATAAVGYADGWRRAFAPGGSARLAGQRIPLVGRVSMDLAVFDVSAVEPALTRPGAWIELIGESRDIDAAASEAGTIGYELLTALGRRHHRVYREP